jgi:hypothetical protein
VNIIKSKGKIFSEKRKSLVTFSFCLILFGALYISVPAQTTPTATPPPVPMASPVKPKVYAPQNPVAKPAYPATYPPGYPSPTSSPLPQSSPQPRAKRKIKNTSAGPAEKAIDVDSKVVVSLCVTSGPVKVNGWDRDEVRAFVESGSSLGFRVLQYNKQNRKAAAVQILGYDPKENKELDIDECLDGDDIELDVPYDAVLNIKGKEGNISVESISKVRIDNISGGITLRDIRNGVEATTFEGDITAEETNGPINLLASTGRILVFQSSPNQIGDPFKAKSRSGAISLQNVEHTDLDVSSATGSLQFTGMLEDGGQYKFNTTSGKIDLSLPISVSCKVTATYGGLFQTLIPFKDLHQFDSPGGVRKIIALLGDGGAALTVTTYNGSIIIKPIKK